MELYENIVRATRTIPEKKARLESIRCQAPKWVLFAQQWNVCRNLIEGSCKYLEISFFETLRNSKNQDPCEYN